MVVEGVVGTTTEIIKTMRASSYIIILIYIRIGGLGCGKGGWYQNRNKTYFT